MARPKRQDGVKIRKELLGYFERGCNVLYTSQQSKHNRKTVTQHFKEFGEIFVEEVDNDFITKQKVVKETCIAQLQGYIDKIDSEIKSLEIEAKMDREDSKTYRAQMHYLLVQVCNLIQQKADIEMTPTIDVSLEQMIEERIHEAEPTRTKTT